MRAHSYQLMVAALSLFLHCLQRREAVRHPTRFPRSKQQSNHPDLFTLASFGALILIILTFSLHLDIRLSGVGFLGQSDASGKSGIKVDQIETHFALMKSESESPSSPSPSPSPCPGQKLETCPHVFHFEVATPGRRFCLLLLLHLLHHPQAWARIKRVSQQYTKTNLYQNYLDGFRVLLSSRFNGKFM